MTQDIAIYIHWPFCYKKCPYCDFNSHVRDEVDHALWLESYLQELRYFSHVFDGKTIKSIFFGGGTPSLMKPDVVAKLLEGVNKISPIASGTEITLEANPTSSEKEKFKDFKRAGINRISIGVQSFDTKELQFLGRQHSGDEAVNAIKYASEVFDRFSFDLIYALPKQSIKSWEKTLEEALKYAATHISVYQLVIEKGTEFFRLYNQGKLIPCKDDRAYEFYNITQEILGAHNLPAYEISNHSTPGSECVHNLMYWNYEEYLGIGPGAHSRIKLDNELHHVMTIHNPENWLASVRTKQHGVQTKELLDIQQIANEYIMMTLRLCKPLEFSAFQQKFGVDLHNFLNQNYINLFQEIKILMYNDTSLALTNKGRLVLNYVVSRIIDV